jgi:hypothetical protein
MDLGTTFNGRRLRRSGDSSPREENEERPAGKRVTGSLTMSPSVLGLGREAPSGADREWPVVKDYSVGISSHFIISLQTMAWGKPARQ